MWTQIYLWWSVLIKSNLYFLRFSFVQSDIAEGIVAWVKYDLNERCATVVMDRDDENRLRGNIAIYLLT